MLIFPEMANNILLNIHFVFARTYLEGDEVGLVNKEDDPWWPFMGLLFNASEKKHKFLGTCT